MSILCLLLVKHLLESSHLTRQTGPFIDLESGTEFAEGIFVSASEFQNAADRSRARAYL